MKWIALAMLLIGIALIGHAVRKSSTASFDNGSFLYLILCAATGAFFFVAGVMTFLILGFMSI